MPPIFNIYNKNDMVVDSSNMASWFFDIFSWERLASVATVFSLAIGGVLPFSNMIKKRRKDQKEAKEKEEIEKIKTIAKDVTVNIEAKLNEQIDKHEDMRYKMQQAEKDNKAILSTVRTLVKEFHSYKNEQQKINTKIYFMDGYIRNNDQGQQPLRTGKRQTYRPVSKEEDEVETYHQYDIDMSDEDTTNNNNAES